MNGPAAAVIREFGDVESDQRYGRLASLFADDATYYDPFFGPQVGRPAIEAFMAHMEEMVPKAGVTFEEWEVVGDTDCGWARWVMHLRDPDGADVPVPGQSIYRLRNGMVVFVCDYVDPVSYAQARPGGNRPDLAAPAGLSAPYAPPRPGSALGKVQQSWAEPGARAAELSSRFADVLAETPADAVRFELADAAGDETVAWAQWWCHLPGGRVPGWSLHTVHDGQLATNGDHIDVVAVRMLG